ncbi:MAG: TraM recognition domain-containing protein [Planctomycetota bacterium]
MTRPEQSRRSVVDRQVNLEHVLLNFSEHDPWTIRNSFEHVFAAGQTGSGKSSGSAKTLVKAMMKAGYGGLLCTAKPGDAETYRQWAEDVGRGDSVVVFGFGQPWKFNPCDYELRVASTYGVSATKNLVDLLVDLSDTVGRKEGKGGGDDQTYWSDQLRALCTNGLDVMQAAGWRVSLPKLKEIVRSAPNQRDQLADENWRVRSACYRCIVDGDRRRSSLSETQQVDFEEAARYWLDEWPNLAPRTRSVIQSTFSALADTISRGELRNLFSDTTNIVPDVTHHGVLLILDMPTLKYGEIGQAGQLIWKILWERSVQRRNVDERTIPCFLFIDECQLLLSESDQTFLTTARSSHSCALFLTQTISNLYAVLGGESKKPIVDALLANMNLKIFHANGDSVTNQWATETLSKEWTQKMTTSEGKSSMPAMPLFIPQGENESTSMSESLENAVEASEFHTLRTGGPPSCKVDALLFRAGKTWKHSGKTSLKVSFDQNI